MGFELRSALACVLLLGPGCSRTVDERESAATAAAQAILDDLTIQVEGGVVVEALAAETGAPVRVRVRATSFDLQVVIQDEGCARRPIDVVVDNVPADADWTWQSWRGALSPVAQAERQCCGALLGPAAAPTHPDWTPIVVGRTFVPGRVAVAGAGAEGRTTCRHGAAVGEVTASAGVSRCWRMALTPSADEAAILEPDAVLPDAPSVGCADFDTLEGGPVRQAPFIMVQRATWRPPPSTTVEGESVIRFAVFGNHAGVSEVRQRLVQAVSDRVESDALRFALVTGDLASSGSIGALDAAVDDLDRLAVPWFATVGERDVETADPEDLVERFGRLTDAFDVYSEGGAVSFRVVLLDSADGGLSRAAFRKLDTWLSDPLAPATRLVATHKPPFEPHGPRGKGFKSRTEAARLVAALKRGGAENLFASHLAIFERQPVGSLTEWHSGGGGAPMDRIENDSHHFLIVSVNNFGALSVERVDL